MEFEWEPGERELGKIETWACYRVPKKQMARLLGISPSTFERLEKHRPAIREALEKGWAVSSEEIHRSAYNMATNGKNPGFLRFWLQAKEGWRTRQHLELSRGGDEIPVEEMPPEKRKERINQLLKLQQIFENGSQQIIDVDPEEQEDETTEGDDDGQ